MFRAVLLVSAVGCINPLTSKAPKPSNKVWTLEERRDKAAWNLRRGDELGAAHPTARRLHQGLALLWAGGDAPDNDTMMVPFKPTVHVATTGTPCPLLDRHLHPPPEVSGGNPDRRVDVEIAIDKCDVDDHTDQDTSTVEWKETVLDKYEVVKRTHQVCAPSDYVGERSEEKLYQPLGGGNKERVVVTTRAHYEGGGCREEDYEDKVPITHEETRRGPHTIYRRSVKVEIRGHYVVRRGTATREGAINLLEDGHSINAAATGGSGEIYSNPVSADSVVDNHAAMTGDSIRRDVDALLGAEADAAAARAKAATDPADVEEAWAQNVAAGGDGGPLAELAAPDVALRYALISTHGDAPQAPRGEYLGPDQLAARYTPSLTTPKTGQLTGAYASLAIPGRTLGVGLAGLRGGASIFNRHQTGVFLADAAFVSAAAGAKLSGDSDGSLSWALDASYAAGISLRNGRGLGLVGGAKAIARAMRLGDAVVGFATLPLFVRLELPLPYGGVMFEGTGVALKGDKVWSAALELTEIPRYGRDPHAYLTLRVERTDVRGHLNQAGGMPDVDLDPMAPKVTTYFLGYGAGF